MKYNLAPNIGVPKDQEKIENKVRAEFSRYMGNQAVIDRSGGMDPIALREAAQTEANFNHLLDHWPNGTPRDFIAQYGTEPMVTTDHGELVVPENVILGD